MLHYILYTILGIFAAELVFGLIATLCFQRWGIHSLNTWEGKK